MTWTKTLILALFVTLATLVATPRAFADEGAKADKWADHKGNLPFIVGYEKGMAEVKLTGKPPMYFFTTTW